MTTFDRPNLMEISKYHDDGTKLYVTNCSKWQTIEQLESNLVIHFDNSVVK